MEPLKLHWASSKKNFGDWLSPALCRLLSGREIEHAQPDRCELLALGSVLGRLSHGWFAHRTTVWGSGFIEPRPAVRCRHDYRAVRGHLTAELIKGASIRALGDPGLLCDRVLPAHRSIPRKYPLGLIPHYRDRPEEAVLDFQKANPDAVVLDVFTDLSELLPQIASCEFILSSSLHGLIVADAFGIPNAWVKISGDLRGDRFKFEDYYSVFSMAIPARLRLQDGIAPGTLEQLKRKYHRPGLDEIRQGLLDAFPFPKH